MKRYRAILLCLLFLPGFVHAQDAEDAEAAAPLPRSFLNIFLGIGLETLKAYLRDDDSFNFREDRDVSLLPSALPSAPEETLVETQGSDFIRRAMFQLRTGEVFIMSFTLNTALVDHYSVFTAFVKKYGEPTHLSPREAVWETEETRVSIERPLTVKYIDKNSFPGLVQGATANGERELLRRTKFLDGF
ncbi:hypothetical protein AGMMS4952_23830 [Spirochaetia bacterium]|nr:hypothetical protein AGMMS4952_23830 [Spirochaetia bacterium]